MNLITLISLQMVNNSNLVVPHLEHNLKLSFNTPLNILCSCHPQDLICLQIGSKQQEIHYSQAAFSLGPWAVALDLLFLEEDAKTKTSWQMLLAQVGSLKEGMVVRSGSTLLILKTPLYLIISLVVDRVSTLASLYLASASLIIALVNWQL